MFVLPAGREDRIAISDAGDVGLVVFEAYINALLRRIGERSAYFAHRSAFVPISPPVCIVQSRTYSKGVLMSERSGGNLQLLSI